VRRGDVLVLCSDGLSGQVRADEITRIVTEEQDLVAACRKMIDRANEMGGPDNITVIAARFDGEGLTDPAETDDVGHRIFPLATDSGQTPAVDRPLSQVTTGEMPAIRRTTREMLPGEVPTAPIIRDDLTKRQSRGSLIALALLLIFLGGALWWVYQTTQQVIAPRHTGTPAAVPPSP
jgi:hypothetical protein